MPDPLVTAAPGVPGAETPGQEPALLPEQVTTPPVSTSPPPQCRCVADGKRCPVTADRFPLDPEGFCAACARHHKDKSACKGWAPADDPAGNDGPSDG